VMEPGEHHLVIDDECYLRRGQRIGLKEGDERTVHLVAKPRRAGIRVDVEDDSGNALDGSIWVDGEELGPAPGPFEVRLCSKQVEVQTSAGGQWSKRFSPGDLAEDEEIEFLARVARAGGPSEGLESFIEWTKAKYGATFCEEHYFNGCYSARGEDQCLAWVGVWFKDCAQLQGLPQEIPMVRYPALGAGLDSCARRESVQTMKKYLQPTLECSKLHSEKEISFGW
jgi:hypothetical protein